MPGMSGLELAERIGGRVPVLFMSGYTGESTPRLPDGQSLMIEKPFGPEDLLGDLGFDVRSLERRSGTFLVRATR